ncbi:MAG: alpha/beta fold hydrolase [Promethearchaeota archaeon]
MSVKDKMSYWKLPIRIEGKFTIGRFIVPFRVFGDKPITIIFVNGAQQTMGIWRDFIKRFKEDYRIIVFDFPGQGRAEILYGDYIVSFEEQMEVLHNVVLALSSLGDNYFVGASWGSIVAAGYASRHPERVKKLLLGSFGSKLNEFIIELMKKGRKLAEEGEIAKIGPLLIDGFGKNIPEALKGAIRKQFQNISIDQVKSFVAHSEFVENTANVMKIVDPKKITARTLMINGEKDTIVDAKENESFASLMQDCEFVIVKGTGHFLHFENPSCYDIYKDFFAK